MKITASLVKELREKSGAGMMDCKKALQETGGEIDKAIDYLREKALSKASKKVDRVAAEGLTFALISDDGKKGAVVEVNSETDFVAKNKEFRDFVATVAKTALDSEPENIEMLKESKLEDGKTLQEALTAKIAKIGENMSIRRFAVKKVKEGKVVSYIHGDGKISAIAALESDADSETLEVLGKDIAMQVAAMNPKYISTDDVDTEFISHEKEILISQALNEGKPKNIVEKMVQGRLKKELKEVCLLEQAFIKDSDISVKKYIENTAAKSGKSIKVTGIQRFEVGEGIEKKSENFADEVAKQMGK